MSKIVSDREDLLGVKDNAMFNSKFPTLDTVVENLLKNNPNLVNIKERL